ncbi:hypothetical protein [Lacticaseibacillus daqingensis]|uniref:hypothetical protein n=1 Tax=Lacticaseibacillus daqingensis TaxID=2486014 RepID=UPI000F7B989B|nr:hypothetical protein [Lacticaseibacillus daqingensis]
MFQYSLRYTLDPRSNTPVKDDKLIAFVQKAKVDNVAFFINPEELNASHLTEAQTQVWLDAIRPLAKRLAALNVSTSLNPWTTIMHSDRGKVIDPSIGFETLVDINGKKATSMGCPADPKWRNYLADRYAQYATLHPRELWLEDDFRHYNHTPLKLACFCDRHMALYQEKLGRAISRADFVKEMLQPGEPTEARRVYLDVARQEMKDTVHQIEGRVHAVSPETNLAQMTSFPNWHAIEGRDWAGLFDNLRGAGHPRVARPHLPAYNEIAPLKYSRVFEDYTRTTAAYLGDDAVLFPELENYMYSPFVKSVAFTRFQIETAALAGASGILLNLFDMIGNGIDDEYHYAEMLADSKAFLDRITTRRLRMSQTRGIQVLVDQDSSYTIHTLDGAAPEEMLPHETNWAALLSTFGFSTTITPVQAGATFTKARLAISGQLLRNFDDATVRQWLSDNVVLLDGEAVQVLLDRGLGDLLHIKSAQWHKVRSGFQSFEAADGHTVEGIAAPRITMLQHTGDYLRLEYAAGADVAIWSHAYNEFDEQLGNVMAVIDHRIVVMPMDEDPKYGWESQYIGFKQGLYQQILSELTDVDYLIGMPNTKLVATAQEGLTLWAANFTLDDYPQIVWHPATPLMTTHATVIARVGDQVQETRVALEQVGDRVIIPVPLAHLQLVQIRFD